MSCRTGVTRSSFPSWHEFHAVTVAGKQRVIREQDERFRLRLSNEHAIEWGVVKEWQLGDRRGVVACHRQKMKPGGLDLLEQLGWVGDEFPEGLP